MIKNGETLKSSRDFNMTPTKKNFRDKRSDRRDEQQRAARDEAYEQRRREPPPQAVNHRQGVEYTEQQGLQPLPPSLRDEEMETVRDSGPAPSGKSRKAPSVAKKFY